ncbi:MAG: hypothetical protein JXR22_00230 [Prolixibacteraceae bacterium]|nr:hypothetical protein [Prolixibacteraceae bacterium]
MRLFEYIQQLWQATYRLMVHPRRHWNLVQQSADFQSGSFRRFMLPWLFVLVLAVFLGSWCFESRYGFLLTDTLIKAVRKVILIVVSFLGANMMIYEISRIYKVPVSFEFSRKMAIYATIPLILALTVTALFPFAYIFGLSGFYALYLVYNALNYLYQVHWIRNAKYLIVLLGLLLMSFIFIAYLLSILTALIIY